MSTLTLITLPIGNIKDITIRAKEALESGIHFYAEDTRVFKKLLSDLGISYAQKHIDSFHDHSEGKIQIILEKLHAGTDVFLVSDAGSPVISDPAYPLLKQVEANGFKLKTLPGVTSVITALELSCLPPHPFHFWGFIARSKNEKKEFFIDLSTLSGTHIFFESPHRIIETAHSFLEAMPEGELVVTRELTKTYESVYRLTKKNLTDLNSVVTEKGEFVVLFYVDQKSQKNQNQSELVELVNDYLNVKGGTKKLAKIFSKILDGDTKKIYDQLTKSDNK